MPENDQANMLQAMIDATLEKQEKIPTVFTNELPPLDKLNEPVLLGIYSYFYRRSRYRMLVKHLCINLREKVLETPPALARAYLRLEYKHSPSLRHAQRLALEDEKNRENGLYSPPNYAQPAQFQYGFYIDIKSAYWSILNVVGWNLDYNPGQWLARGRPPSNFPLDHKNARHCLVSCAQSNQQSIYYPWPDDEIRYENRGNSIANIGLWRLVTDVLNSVAADAVRAGAIYANTDGYIAPSIHAKKSIEGAITDWGLPFSIKAEGIGKVTTTAAYSIGKQVSGHMKFRTQDAFIDAIHEPSYSKWLKERFTHFAADT